MTRVTALTIRSTARQAMGLRANGIDVDLRAVARSAAGIRAQNTQPMGAYHGLEDFT